MEERETVTSGSVIIENEFDSKRIDQEVKRRGRQEGENPGILT